jgi:hypothetical protein
MDERKSLEEHLAGLHNYRDDLDELVGRREWIFPPWPETARGPMNVDVGPVLKTVRFEREIETPDGKVRLRGDERLPKELHERLLGEFLGGIAVAVTAVEYAVAFYDLDLRQGSDWPGETREVRARAREAKWFERLDQSLGEILSLSQELTDERRGRLGATGELQHTAWLGLSRLLEGTKEVPLLREHIRGIVSDLGQPVGRGPGVDIARRRLVYRLMMIWKTFTDGSLRQKRATGWPFGDFIEAIMKPITGASGDTYARELAYSEDVGE